MSVRGSHFFLFIICFLRFKYNSCVGSRSGDYHRILFCTNLNTTLVSVRVSLFTSSLSSSIYLNTTLVSVRGSKPLAKDSPERRFKYNSCVGSRGVSWTCAASGHQFKYNSCVGSRSGDYHRILFCTNLNTTLVSVRAKVLRKFDFLKSDLNTTLVSVRADTDLPVFMAIM